MHENAGFESVGNILKRIRFDRASLEQLMTAEFDRTLSLQIDALVELEEAR